MPADRIPASRSSTSGLPARSGLSAAGLALVLLAPGPLAAQSGGGPDAAEREGSRPMVTDRPDFTESAVAVRRLQIEAGYTLTPDGATDDHRVGEVLLRIPAVDRLELRLGLPSWEGSGPPGIDEGFGDASVGAKVELVRGGTTGRPRVALLAGADLPVDDRGSEGAVPGARLAASMPLSPRLGLAVNAGAASSEDPAGRFAELVGSVALGLELGGGLGVYGELYGFERTGGRPADGFADAGVTWGLGPDLQLDARVAVPLDGDGEDFALGVGISARP